MRKLLALLLLLPALAWAGTNATLYVRSTQTHLNPSYDVEVARGSSAANSGALTCVGATPSTFRTYYSEAATGTAVLNGNITGSIWSAQSNAGCNNGGRITVSRRTSGGTETQICVATGYAEFANGGTTATAASLGTCAASSFTINSGDRLKVVLDRVQIGTGGTTRNSTLYWDGPTAAQSGDTYITLPQCVPGITDTCTADASATLVGIAGTGALGGTVTSTGEATRTLTEITGSGALGGLLSYSTADVTDASATLVAVAGEGALGTLTSTGAATLTISEISGTGAVGLLDYAASASATLTEITGTAVLGALSLAGDAMCGLVGLAGEGALGLLSTTDQVNAAVHLLGISGVGALGHLYVTESLIKMMEEGTCGGVRGGGGTLERPKTGGSNE